MNKIGFRLLSTSTKFSTNHSIINCLWFSSQLRGRFCSTIRYLVYYSPIINFLIGLRLVPLCCWYRDVTGGFLFQGRCRGKWEAPKQPLWWQICPKPPSRRSTGRRGGSGDTGGAVSASPPRWDTWGSRCRLCPFPGSEEKSTPWRGIPLGRD